MNTNLVLLDINNIAVISFTKVHDFAFARLTAVYIDHFFAGSRLLLISIWLKNKRNPSVLFRAYAADDTDTWFKLRQFAGNKTSTGMGPKCIHAVIAKQARIVWLNKKQ